jgi:hypothetical protein
MAQLKLTDIYDEIVLYYLHSFLEAKYFRNLLNISKYRYSSLKQNNLLWRLNEECSIRYIEEESFRERLHSKLNISPASKSGICIRYQGKRSLTQERVQQLRTCLQQSHLIRKLVLHHVDYKLSTRIQALLSEAKNFCYLENLNIWHHPMLTDLTSFSSLRKISLTSYQGQIDISPLKKVREIELSELRDLNSLSGLLPGPGNCKYVDSLCVDSCTGIADFTILNQIVIHSVSLTGGFPHLRSLKGLENIPRIHIHQFVGEVAIVDLGPGTKHLSFNAAAPENSPFHLLFSIESLSMQLIPSAPPLPISDETPLKSKFVSFSYGLIENPQVHFLSLLREVYLVNSPITNASALGAVHILSLVNCSQLVDISGLGANYKLVISNCPKVKDVNHLGSVHRLWLYLSPEVEDISQLGRVHTLGISSCRKLGDFSALGRGNHTLSLIDVGVSSVAHLSTVYNLTLASNEVVYDLISLKDVPVIRFGSFPMALDKSNGMHQAMTEVLKGRCSRGYRAGLW